ncbi:MAG: hypothetical protein JXQ29_11355 [Planctomycetes bacterium]|nr:hypothetical protein [Planctomycetota bacterium]
MRETFVIALLSILVAGVAAQNHPNGYVGGSGSGQVIFFSSQGVATTVTVGTSTCYGLVMDAPNRVLLAANLDNLIYRVDPVTRAIIGSIPGVSSPYDLAIDCHGDLIVATSSAVLKIDASNTITTIASALSTIYGGMTIDPNTGDILVQSAAGTDPVLRVARDGSSVVTLGGGMDARYGMDYHIPTDSIYSGSCCGDFSPADAIYQLPMLSTTATIFLGSAAPPVGVYSLKADRSSAAVPRLVLGAFAPAASSRGPGGIFHIDVATKSVTTFSTLPPNASLYETEILYRRNVQTIRTATGQWAVGIKIPEDWAKVFVLAVSTTGIRPGVPLPGGRTAYLTPDTVTFLGLTTGLAPFLTGAAGQLDAGGEAVAKLNLTAIGKPANGLRLFFLALTLNPAAPGGIETVTDPTVLLVEGL